MHTRNFFQQYSELHTPHCIASFAATFQSGMFLFPNVEIKFNTSRCGIKDKSMSP